MTPSVSIVICTASADRWPWLCECIASLRRQTTKPDEIIIVVDHDPALLALVTREVPEARGVPNWEAPGPAGSRNSGTAVCHGEVVAFLDDDAAAAPDWLERLLEPYATGHVVGVGGRIDPVWPDRQPRWFPPEFAWVVGCSYVGLPSAAAPVRNLIACNMSVRRSVLIDAGMFRTSFGQAKGGPLRRCEETELCIRIRQRSPESTILYEPRAKVTHRVSIQRARFVYFAHRCYSEGRSKAQVTHALGCRDGLAAERRYMLSTLPRGILRELINGHQGEKLDGLRRGGAMASGLFLTAAAYGLGVVLEAASRTQSQAPGPTPPDGGI